MPLMQSEPCWTLANETKTETRWSSPAMAKRYQHVLDAIHKDVADQVGGRLWEGIEIEPDRGPGRPEDRPGPSPG